MDDFVRHYVVVVSSAGFCVHDRSMTAFLNLAWETIVLLIVAEAGENVRVVVVDC